MIENFSTLSPNKTAKMSNLVGVQGIEPCLPAPKAGVLPVYDTPKNLGGQEALILAIAPQPGFLMIMARGER